jgi:arylsulfatase
MTDKPNVFLLTVDALRADHLGYHGYERDTSPFLDSLADRAVYFTTAISASSHTREAIPALLTGRYPDLFAANGYRCVTDTVADHLQTAGYDTAGFHSNPYVSRAYRFDSGFDTFDDDLRLGQHRVVALIQRALEKFLLNKGEYHARAETINDRSLDWLATVDDGPIFLWNHYMDPHGPYNPPNGYSYVDEAISNSEAHDLYQTVINHPNAVSVDQKELLLDC